MMMLLLADNDDVGVSATATVAANDADDADVDANVGSCPPLPSSSR